MLSVRIGMDSTYGQDLHQGPQLGYSHLSCCYHVSSRALIPQLQLWPLCWLGSLNLQVLKALHYLSHRDTAAVIETHAYLDDGGQHNVV